VLFISVAKNCHFLNAIFLRPVRAPLFAVFASRGIGVCFYNCYTFHFFLEKASLRQLRFSILKIVFHFFLEKKVELQLQGSRKIAKNDVFYRK
jgi:hypothetical protein